MLMERTKTTLPVGYTTRATTMSDLETVVDLMNVSSRAMIGVEDATINETRNEWTLPNFDLAADTQLIFNSDGQLVGYIEVWRKTRPGKVWVWGRVHPDFEGQGIGSYMMAWGEERAREVIKNQPPDSRMVIEAGTFSTYERGHRLLVKFGMTPIRHFWRMVTDLDDTPPTPIWPQNITLTTLAEFGNLRPVVAAIEDAFKDHWGHVERPFEEEFIEWEHWLENDDDHDPSLCFLALDRDEIAGVSLCQPKVSDDAQMGWIDTLGVCRPWRRQGLALALLHHSFGEFYRRGQKRAGLGVDSASLTGATQLYEKAGMKVVRQFDTYEKELRPGRDLSRRILEE